MARDDPGAGGVPRLLVGLDLAAPRDLAEAIEAAEAQQYDFVLSPLFHPRQTRDTAGVSAKRGFPATRSDTLLPGKIWRRSVVGKASAWPRLEAQVEPVRRRAEAALQQELAWAKHLPLTAVLLPFPRGPAPPINYARVLCETCAAAPRPGGLQLWVRVPLADARAEEWASAADRERVAGEGSEALATALPWRQWDTLRTLCEQSGALHVALELSADLPPQGVLKRWLGEPLKAIVLPTDIFLSNQAGFPALSRRHQQFVMAALVRGVHAIIAGEPSHAKAEGHLTYLQYLQHLHGKCKGPSEAERFSVPYDDFLQAPLQPLQDNLESSTYETFESDPVKYGAYEEAVAEALVQRHPDRDVEVLLMVLGAGRGPLVHASLTAAARTGHRLRIYAVEKNPNAVITLRNRVLTDGWDQVVVIGGDMRRWRGDDGGTMQRADIIVSELLGSFGDNELSPECLDGAQWLLKNPGGISIPCKYTSYLAPLSSAKLWNDVKAHDSLKMFETAFVVKLKNVFEAAPPQPAFVFEHPSPEYPDRIDNRRAVTLRFRIGADTTLHGLAGYFDSQLFGNVRISIHPETHSPDMYSWFPIYFPFRSPVRVAAGSVVAVHMWRCVSATKVWYEWALSEPSVTPIHNPGGRSYFIGL